MATFYSAKNAKVRYGATVVTAKQWDVTPEVDLLETTNFEGNGFKETIPGIKSLRVQIQLDDDGSANLFDAGVVAGASLSSFKLYLNGVAGPYWSLTLNVQSHGQRADVKQQMSNTISGEATGTFVYPTGNAA